MYKFFFHIHTTAGDARDAEGQDLPSAAAAHEKAIDKAREIMAADIRTGELWLSSYIDVEDEKGAHVTTVEFQQAVKIDL